MWIKRWRIAWGVWLLLLCASLIDRGGIRRWLLLRRQMGSLEERNQKLALENHQLIEEIESLRKDKRALERAAREELGFVRPGELVFNLE